MRKWFCDRCKKEIAENGYTWVKVEKQSDRTKTYDLCHECAKLHYDFLNLPDVIDAIYRRRDEP